MKWMLYGSHVLSIYAWHVSCFFHALSSSACLSTPRQSHATQASLAQAYPYQSIPVTLPHSVLAKTIPAQESHYHAQYAHTARPHHIVETKISPRKMATTRVVSEPTEAIYFDGKTISAGAAPMQQLAQY